MQISISSRDLHIEKEHENIAFWSGDVDLGMINTFKDLEENLGEYRVRQN